MKLRLLGSDDALLATSDLPSTTGVVDREALGKALSELPAADAVGHRVVHGGQRYRGAVRIDAEVHVALEELSELAPLHQPKSLDALAAVSQVLPDLPAVACFDTAFHATLPAAAATYALPAAWRDRWALRRYGFHGLSHAYADRRATALLDRPAGSLRVVICHLGAGASLAAVRNGVSIDTTMGFTPLDGLVMATRCGSVDPGLLLWLQTEGKIDANTLSQALEQESGLLGLTGTDDMREVLAREDDDAKLALDVYLHRLRSSIAAMAAALEGLDALVFTGGVGEGAPTVREGAVRALDFLGVQLDRERNQQVTEDADVSAPGAAVRCLVITAREDLEIARQAREVLS